MQAYHVPALFEESMEALRIRPDGTYVDLTFGGGGHSRGILAAAFFDRGGSTGSTRTAMRGRTCPTTTGSVSSSPISGSCGAGCVALGVERVDGILADLGVSSHHFDTRQRGFSFRFDAPLDMRMNQRAGS